MSSMYANELDTPAPLAERPLQWRMAPKPEPAEGQLLIEVAGCGVSPAASCAPAASWRTFRNIDLETVVLLLQRVRTLKTSP